MEATEINTKLLERLSDYVDDEYTGDVLVISVFENIRFAEDRTELEKVLGPKAKKKYISIDWNQCTPLQVRGIGKNNKSELSINPIRGFLLF